MRNRIHLSVLLFLCLSCANARIPTKTFSYQTDAGSVHVAIQSIAPFDEEYISQLQPALPPLTDEQALGAIAQTQILEIQKFRASLIQAGLLLPDKTLSSTKETTGGTTTTTTTEKTTPPAADKIPGAPEAVSQTIEPFEITDKSIKSDLALTYHAIFALRQEIALLNRQVRDAAVSRGARPYVVRFLLTLNPLARHEPYDAYTTISLFADKPETTLPGVISDDEPVLKSTLTKLRDFAAKDKCGKPLEVIPLFVTENLESSFDSVALESVNSLGLGAGGTVQNVAARFGGRFQANDQTRGLSRSLNALFTMARISGGSVEARLGAFTTDTEFMTVPRTYNMTVLALLPTVEGSMQDTVTMLTGQERDIAEQSPTHDIAVETLACQGVAFTSVYRFVNVTSGKALAFSNAADIAIRQLAQTWKIDEAQVGTLVSFAEFDRYDRFSDAIPGVKDEAKQMLWLDLVNAARATGRSYGRITVPIAIFELPGDTTPGTVIDDGESASVTIAGARNLTGTALSARLDILPDEHAFYATNINVAADGRKATMTFPSPLKLLKCEPPVDARVILERSRGGHSFEPQVAYRWVAATKPAKGDAHLTYVDARKVPPKPKDPPGVTMDVTAPHVVITGDDTSGTFAVSFRSDDPQKPKNVRLSVVGGYIVSVSPAATPDGPDQLVVGHQTYQVTVKNLVPNGKLTVRSFLALDKGKQGDLVGEKTIDVIEKSKQTADKPGK